MLCGAGDHVYGVEDLMSDMALKFAPGSPPDHLNHTFGVYVTNGAYRFTCRRVGRHRGNPGAGIRMRLCSLGCFMKSR